MEGNDSRSPCPSEVVGETNGYTALLLTCKSAMSPFFLPIMRQIHPELSAAYLEAVHNYSGVPEGLRRSFGG
jgi:hypothetical protein